MMSNPETLSPKQLVEMLGVERPTQDKASSQKNLVPNLNNKSKYILHYRNLRQYLELAGMNLRYIHRVLSFNRVPCLNEYNDFETQKRSAAVNNFEKKKTTSS